MVSSNGLSAVGQLSLLESSAKFLVFLLTFIPALQTLGAKQIGAL